MAAMARPNRNCCWVGQPDPTAWKKPTGDGCLGYARKPQYRLMRPSESAMLELIENHTPILNHILSCARKLS